MLEPAEEISDTQIGKLTVKTVCHFYVAGGRLEDEMPFLNKIFYLKLDDKISLTSESITISHVTISPMRVNQSIFTI